MKEYITISELSKLMDVSVHQIRYFEEKEILFPSHVAENQYRMYGMAEIYQLAHILLLRKLKIPVSQIKECIEFYSSDDYSQMLKASLMAVQSEMNQLAMLERFLQKTLYEHDNIEIKDSNYQTKYLPVRHLKKWMKLEKDEAINARILYEQKPRQPHLFETDIHYLWQGNQLWICFETSHPADLALQEGNYLYKPLLASDFQEVEQAMRQLEQYLTTCQHTGPWQMVVLERSFPSMFHNSRIHYEIQVKLDKSADGECG